MACSIPKKERKKEMQLLVLEHFRVTEDDPSITLLTSLGPDGIGHLPKKRKGYYAAFKAELVARQCNCEMQTLRPNSFGDLPKNATVGQVADMLGGDIG
jgi:hypothetical protein